MSRLQASIAAYARSISTCKETCRKGSKPCMCNLFLTVCSVAIPLQKYTSIWREQHMTRINASCQHACLYKAGSWTVATPKLSVIGGNCPVGGDAGPNGAAALGGGIKAGNMVTAPCTKLPVTALSITCRLVTCRAELSSGMLVSVGSSRVEVAVSVSTDIWRSAVLSIRRSWCAL